MVSIYLIVLLSGYVASGVAKFVIRAIRARKIFPLEFGMGGMPSTHVTVVTSVGYTVAQIDGYDSSSFGVCLALLVIVSIDAIDLRKKIEIHAQLLKSLLPNSNIRLRLGHTKWEVFAGMLLGCIISEFVLTILNMANVEY